MEKTPLLLKLLVVVGMFSIVFLIASLAFTLLSAEAKSAVDRTVWICSQASLLPSPKTALYEPDLKKML